MYSDIKQISLQFVKNLGQISFTVTPQEGGAPIRGIMSSSAIVYHVSFSFIDKNKTLFVQPDAEANVDVRIDSAGIPCKVSIIDNQNNLVRSFQYNKRFLSIKIKNSCVSIADDETGNVKSSYRTQNDPQFVELQKTCAQQKNQIVELSAMLQEQLNHLNEEREKAECNREFEKEKNDLIERYEEEKKNLIEQYEREKIEYIRKTEEEKKNLTEQYEKEKTDYIKKNEEEKKNLTEQYEKEKTEYIRENDAFSYKSQVIKMQETLIQYDITVAEWLAANDTEQLNEKISAKREYVEALYNDQQGRANAICDEEQKNLIAEYVKNCIMEIKLTEINQIIQNRKKMRE